MRSRTRPLARCRGALPWLSLFVQVAVSGVSIAQLSPAPLASPGETGRVVDVDRSCPTFSWGEVSGAEEYELVVRSANEAEAGAPPLLRRTFPSGVSSWTPAPGECFEAGRVHVWSITVRGAGGEGAGSESVSSPAGFVVGRGRGPERPEVTALLERARALAIELESPGEVDLAGREAVREPAATGTAQMTVSGHVTAASLSGSAANLTGLTATDVSCLGCVGASDVETGAITADKIPVGGVFSIDIADGVIDAAEIATGAIQSSHLADDAVTSSDLGPGSVGQSEVGPMALGIRELGPFSKRIECNGECDDATLGDVCTGLSGTLAVFSPHGVPDPGGATSSCGGDNSCRVLGDLSPSLSLGDVCPDGSGWDCIVICA